MSRKQSIGILIVFLLVICSIFLFQSFLKSGYENLERSQQKWQKADIADYKIRIRAFGAWFDVTYSITIINNEVESFERKCDRGDCEIGPQPKDLMVDGLFSMVRKWSKGERRENIDVVFDSKYGYPIYISYDEMYSLDEEFVIDVISFEAIE
jgi:hypothetical protein